MISGSFRVAANYSPEQKQIHHNKWNRQKLRYCKRCCISVVSVCDDD